MWPKYNLKFYLIMKRHYLYLLSIFFLVGAISLSSCNDDDDNGDNGDNQEPENIYTYSMGTTTYTVNKEEKTVKIKDAGEGLGTEAVTFSADTTYLLDGFVFVNSGQTLTIEAGTMIQGMPGQGENASALIVAKGATINAAGTADKPIVFTGLNDTYEGDGYLKKVRGLWGGVIILGNATTNNSAQKRIEGIPSTEPRGVYGPADGGTGADDDNSGTFTYVSIRHGGTNIGDGNEINGLSLGCVGSGTTLENIEILSNMDDGIEFFGGAPNVKKAVVAFVGDDSYDYDEGFHGKGQFWVALQDEETGDRCAEQDGGTGDDEAAEPFAKPMIYNATYMGHGGKLMIFRDNAGGTYANSVFAETGTGIRIEYRDDKGACSWDRFAAGDLVIKDNIFQNVAGEVVADMLFVKVEDDNGTPPATAADDLADHFNDNGNAATDLGLTGDGHDDGINLVPATGADGGTAPTDAWFDNVTYQGAFQPGATSHWATWTLAL